MAVACTYWISEAFPRQRLPFFGRAPRQDPPICMNDSAGPAGCRGDLKRNDDADVDAAGLPLLLGPALLLATLAEGPEADANADAACGRACRAGADGTPAALPGGYSAASEASISCPSASLGLCGWLLNGSFLSSLPLPWLVRDDDDVATTRASEAASPALSVRWRTPLSPAC